MSYKKSAFFCFVKHAVHSNSIQYHDVVEFFLLRKKVYLKKKINLMILYISWNGRLLTERRGGSKLVFIYFLENSAKGMDMEEHPVIIWLVLKLTDLYIYILHCCLIPSISLFVLLDKQIHLTFRYFFVVCNNTLFFNLPNFRIMQLFCTYVLRIYM